MNQSRLSFAALAVSAFLIPSTMFAAQLEGLYTTDKNFQSEINKALTPLQAVDAFADLGACRLIDGVTIKPYTLDEAVKSLGPCLKNLSLRYDVTLTAKPGLIEDAASKRGAAIGIIIWVEGKETLASPALKDLGHAINTRNKQLLGFKACLRRPGDKEPALISVVQKAIDSCFVVMVVRPIESSADLIRYYGRCITEDPTLKIKEIQPSSSHDQGIIVASAAKKPTVESLPGTVSINSISGPVTFLVMVNSD